MGIPRLISYLQPYSVPAVLGCKTPQCSEHHPDHPSDNGKVVIDGPGFAFHVFYALLACKPPSLNPFDATPSYAEIGQAAIAFLQELRLYGLTIEKIYFDGCLPERKEDVRLSRLQSYTRELAAFRTLHPKCVPASRQPVTAARENLDNSHLFSHQPVPAQFRGLPAPPFLVPAVLDALSKSQYATVTEIVAGEAEAYCAHHVQTDGGIALTSDSDMLVYDLGASGAVAFFKQLECRRSRPSKASLDCCQLLLTDVFRPREIARRLGLDSLQRLAFEIKLDSHVKIKSAVQLSLQQPGDRAAFTYFLAEYVGKDNSGGIPEAATSNPSSIGDAECFVDPRLSELLTSISASPSPDTLTMYLPFLIDDPSRVSAWAPSLRIRQLLYSCLPFLFPINPHVHSVTECCRKGHVIGSAVVPMLSDTDTAIVAEHIVSALHDCFSDCLSWDSRKVWWAFALVLILAWHEQEERTPPSRMAVIRACNGAVSAGMLTWDDVQLSAQIQGVLYSLRMLQQLFRKATANAESLPPSLTDIVSIIRHLPHLAHLMPSRLELVQSIGNVDMLDLVNMAMNIVDEWNQRKGVWQAKTPEDANDDGFETVSSRKRKKKASKKLSEAKYGIESKKPTVKSSDQGGNRFSFLANA